MLIVTSSSKSKTNRNQTTAQCQKPSGHISSSGIIRDSIATSHDSTSESTIHGIDKTYVMKSFQPFIFDGCVSLADDSSTSTPIRILRDTGSSQSLMLAETSPFSSSSYTGAHVLIQGVESDEYCASVLFTACTCLHQL